MTTSAPTASAGSSGPQPRQVKKDFGLKSQDFIKMMITQLQNQDPMQPAKNEELLAQMSQISQMESSGQLTETLKGITQQNQIGSAAALIGKSVKGLDSNNNDLTGNVVAVSVTSDGANLELDNGQSLALTRVTSIGPPRAAN
ncbi:MAG TPA: flagellar hook capping FlgD N-terminal domain-containing protein [Tepidisphaeraceae bacterium]|nr:flagellar hook capping FlgD N-terminal domain-containing protein [Tepidisphaeraceae bacterium]